MTRREWITAGTTATACVAMDCHGGPTGRVLPVETTDRYAEYARWDDACHLLAGYSLGVVLGVDGADRRTVCRRFLAVTAAWEMAEFVASERPWDGSTSTRGAIVDTLMDTVMGTVGAFVGASGR